MIECANIECSDKFNPRNIIHKYCSGECRDSYTYIINNKLKFSEKIDRVIRLLGIEQKDWVRGMIYHSYYTNTIPDGQIDIMRVTVCLCEDNDIYYSLKSLFGQHRRSIELDLLNYEIQSSLDNHEAKLLGDETNE